MSISFHNYDHVFMSIFYDVSVNMLRSILSFRLPQVTKLLPGQVSKLTKLGIFPLGIVPLGRIYIIERLIFLEIPMYTE
jgi:hypothetical protein